MSGRVLSDFPDSKMGVGVNRAIRIGPFLTNGLAGLIMIVRTLNRRPWLGLCCLLLITCAALRFPIQLEGSPARGDVPVIQAPAPDPLLALNDSFREAYARCRQQVIERSGPVILVEGDNLVLIREGKRTEVRVIPELYQTLKAVSHVPLAIYAMLIPGVDAPLGKDTVEFLQGYRTRVVNAAGTLKNRTLPGPTLLRQEEIIKSSLAFLDSVVQTNKVSKVDLEKFTREQGPRLLANAAESAQAEIDALDKQLKVWRADLPENDWKKLHIVVMGSALPRAGNLAIQYFAQALNEPGEGKRIIYAEALFDEKRALNLLGTHLVDTGIGTYFFDDAGRMHRDLLADAAKEYLEKMAAKP
jgi:hypothetical protein